MTPTLHTIDLPGRVRLQFAERGDPAGMPVIALHGVTDSWRSFEPVLPHLPASLHVYALTQRGHGDSGKPETGYRPADFAADVAAFMDALRIERAVIVGHSMGSVNAMRFALDHPSRVRALVLAGTMPFFGGHAELVSFHREQITPLIDPVAPEFAREFQLGTIAQPVSAAFVATAVAESLKVPAHVWRGAFDGFMGDDFSARLPQIDVPTLIVWGRHDAFCTEAAQHALRAALPSARLIEYADAGHAMHWEEPRRFARDLAEFVATTAAPAAVA
jgi:pimeloyl-ACP methyl ester carboxylesterase